MTQPLQLSSRARALGAMALAVLALGGAGWMGWLLGWPDKFDTTDPDFVNPFSILIVGLLAVSGWFTVAALRNELRHRAFGVTRLEIDAPGALRLGRVFSGRLRVQKPVAATGPFRLVLTCVDVHRFEDEGGAKTSDFPVWTGEQTLPPDTDATSDLRFRFSLPASVGPEPVPSGILPGAGSGHRVTVHIPGLRKVVTSNIPPVARYWTLVATAPTPGPDFRAEMVVPVDDMPRTGRLP